jgi:putative membrane protein
MSNHSRRIRTSSHDNGANKFDKTTVKSVSVEESASMQPMTSGSTQPGAPESTGAENAVDATRRTRLANERTYLAWWRTGLASLAVSLGAGKLVPALTPGAQWPYTIVGIGFAGVGMVFIGYAFLRHRHVEQAISRGEFSPPGEGLMTVLAVVGVLLGLLVLVIVAAKT